MWRYEAGEFDDDQYYEMFCKATGTRPDQRNVSGTPMGIFSN